MSSDSNGGVIFDAANGSKYGIKSGRGNNPIVYFSWYDSIRFTNWLHNGQGSGDTESGAYTLRSSVAAPSPLTATTSCAMLSPSGHFPGKMK